MAAYYGRLARIGLDLAGVILPTDRFSEAVSAASIDLHPSIAGLRRAAGRVDIGRVANERPSPASPVLLIEADGDGPGFGVFVVENLTAEPVSAAIRVSRFADEGGREVTPRLHLRPATVSLGPGEQAMVQLAAELDDALEPGVRYRGEIAIPALSDRRIPIILRRRPAIDPGGQQRSASPTTTRRRRTTSTAGRQAPASPEATTRPRRRQASSGPDAPR